MLTAGIAARFKENGLSVGAVYAWFSQPAENAMTKDEMKSRLNDAIQATLDSQRGGPFPARQISYSVAIGMAAAMQLCELVEGKEYSQIIQRITDSIEHELAKAAEAKS